MIEAKAAAEAPAAADGREERLAATWLLAIVVCAVYVFPIVLGLVFDRELTTIIDYDDRLYIGRIAEAYRGGTLGNIYLAGHDNAPKYMPELAERATAAAARLLGSSPYALAATNRVVFPVLIFCLVAALARRLGCRPELAALSGLATVFMPSVTRSTGAYAGETLGFARYFSPISPTVHVVLLLAALLAVARLWSKPRPLVAITAAVLLGILFYTPPYYWSFAAFGTFLLALSSERRTRWWMLGALAGGIVLGAPALLHSFQVRQLPEVEQTLHRMQLMIPGRVPETVEMVMSALTLCIVAVVALRRRAFGPGARFLVAYLAGGALLLFQCVVTGRKIQDFHFAHCLVPLAYVAFAAIGSTLRVARAWKLALATVLVAAGVATQSLGYDYWVAARQTQPDLYHFDARFPQTIAWLQQHARGEVALASSVDRMEALAIFAEVKVYWAVFADQYVISDREAEARSSSYAGWRPGQPAQLPYRADIFVGVEEECASVRGAVAYRNATEHTCVIRLLAPGAAPAALP